MRMSDEGRKRLTVREGVRLKAYKDTKGIWTIGIGHTSAAGQPQVYPGLTITAAECDAIFKRDLVQYEDAVNKAVKVPLAQHQFDALVSFCFNIGTGGLARSLVVRRINAGDMDGAAKAFMNWVKPKEITGRRRTEMVQFQTPYRGTPTIAQPSAPSLETAAAPVDATEKPGLWATFWRLARGKDATVATPATQTTPAANQFRQVQDLLASKGYVEVGQPDGFDGPRTRSAVRAFRAENGLGQGDAIDEKLIAALTAAGPRQIAKARVEATANDLREKGNTQVKTLDGMGWLAKALGLGGIIGGINESGILNTASDTLQTAQDTLGTVATVFTTIISMAQWVVSHWWIFAIGAALWLAFKVATGILNLVVLFRQGILSRGDK